MATAVEDLWPADIESPPDQLAPITILKQQAAMLGRRTKNLLEAVVQTEDEDLAAAPFGDTTVRLPLGDQPVRLRHTLFLVAPALNFYRYRLLEASHAAVNLYPVTIRAGWERHLPTVVEQMAGAPHTRSASNEAEFKEVLKDIFAHEETKRIIGSLIAQSGEQRSQDPDSSL
jgi:hypothetical protein